MASITGNIIENVTGSITGAITTTGNMSIINRNNDVILNGNNSIGNNFLNTSSNSTINGNVTSSTVTVKGDIDISGNIIGNVTGDISNNIINVIGNVYAGTTNNAFNNFALLGNMDISGNLDLSGNMTIGGNKFTVNKDTGNTNILGSLYVLGTSTLTGNTGISSDLDLSGNMNISGNKFTVQKNTGNTNIAGSLTVTGASNLSSINLSGNKFTIDSSGNTSIAGTLNVSSASSLASLNVSGISALYNNTTIGGTLDVTGVTTLSNNTNINGTLDVTGVTTLFNNTSIEGTLGVIGLTTLSNNTNIEGLLNVAGDTTLFSNTSIGGTLNVTGASSLSSLNVSGTSTLTGNSTVGGTLGVTGVTTLSNNTTINGTLGVTGASTLSGNTTIGGTLGVTGISTLSGNTNVGGLLNVTGATTLTNNTSIGGTLNVTGASSLSSLSVNTLTLTGNSTVGGTLNVTGASTLSGNTTIGGTLGVTGASTLNGNTSVGGTLNVSGNTTLSGSVINLGANNSTINIGSSGSTVNILGTTNTIQTTNLQVTDNIITLNKNGAIASSSGSGIEFEENNAITGYIKVSSDRNNYNVKAPNNSTIYTLTLADPSGNVNITGNNTITGNLNINGNITSAGNNIWNGTNYFSSDASFNNVNTNIKSSNQLSLYGNTIDISGNIINMRNIPSSIKTNVLYYDTNSKAISYGLAASSTLNSSSNVLDYSYNMVLYDPLQTSQSYSSSIIQKYRGKWSSSPSVLLTLSQVGGTAYGQSSAISSDGSIIAVSAPGENKVYIYTKTSNDWSSKTTSTIVAPQNGGFGNSIALTPNGNTLVIGANGVNNAYVYTKESNASWSASPTLTTTLTGPGSGNFGFSVSVSNDSSYIVVGAYSNDIAYVYRKTGATWTSNSVITISGNSSTFFGVSVAISGDSNTIVIGAYAGVSAYIFTKLSNNNWSTSLNLANATSTLSGPANSAFGNSIAISGDYNTIVVGAYVANNAYVYAKSAGSSWSATPSVSSTLYGPASSWFGAYVGISSDGNNIVVGAISTSISYIYSKLAYTWAAYPVPIPTSSMTGPFNSFFGKSVAISGDSTTIVIGATSTSTAYIYNSYLSNFIGIGNNTPNFTLDVSGTFHVMSNSGSYARIEADTNAPDIYSGIEFGIPAFSSAQRSKIISYTKPYNASGIRFDVHRGINVNLNDLAEQALTIGGDGTLNTYFNGNIGIGLSSANINTNARITLAGPNVANQIEFQNLDAVADSKKWAMGPNGNIFYIYTAKDDYTVTANAIQIHRNLNTIQYVNFPNGNIGIGTLTPSNKLQIRKNLGTSNLYLNNTIHELQFEISKATDNRSMAFGVMDDGIGVIMAKEVNVGYKSILLNPIGGNIGIGIFDPSYKLHVGGDIYATGDITALSDINAKKDITTITNAMDKVNKLRGVYYTTIETDKKCIGLIAQETKDIIPEVVSDISGNIGISYGNMVGLLVEALKESDIKMNELKNKNEALEKRLELLEKLLLNN